MDLSLNFLAYVFSAINSYFLSSFRLKTFADQRIRVKAKGRHKATKNPVKQLQDREDLRSDTDEVRIDFTFDIFT